MRIKLNSVLVDNQSKALTFYTEVLGFVVSQDVPVGEFRWLTVRSPEGGETELILEPNANPAAKEYQEALFGQGIPLTAFEVDDVKAEFQSLRTKGVEFTTEPLQAGPVWIAIFSDTCGNLIQIYQPPET
ncbi:VOC family protein [Marinobacter sp. SS13-12]|uniref:VOC family protein n=1 Tax=Marinobacter sp. SS13-12 TaxID=3050451 RepID=UPI002552F899|nr:VOC family protein [Marinobacter sp. SS13-12]MDK8462030.1 VOC family protein [Marinobacter sp. SS13-12]